MGSFAYPSQHHRQVGVLGAPRLNALSVVKCFVNRKALLEPRTLICATHSSELKFLT